MSAPVTLPSDLPGLREEAERLARETHLAFADAADKLIEFPGHVPPWAETMGAYRAAMVNAHAALLCDLSRPASRDWAARWLAERLGLTVGATAPTLVPHSDRRGWSIVVDVRHHHDEPRFVFFVESDAAAAHVPDGPLARIAVPGISDIHDPTAALRLAVLAVAGRAECTTPKGGAS